MLPILVLSLKMPTDAGFVGGSFKLWSQSTRFEPKSASDAAGLRVWAGIRLNRARRQLFGKRFRGGMAQAQ